MSRIALAFLFVSCIAHATPQPPPKLPELPGTNEFEIPGGGGGPTVDPQVMVEHIERQGVDERLQADDENLMGDQIDPNTGSLVFSHTDVSIPGNSGLAVAITRRREQGLKYYPNTDVDFGDWILDVPRISTVLGFRTQAGSQTETATWSSNRCTDIGAPPPKALNIAGEPVPPPPGGGSWTLDTLVLGHQYSNGLQLELPGQGAQMILDSPQGTAWDKTSSGWTTRKITLSNWVFDCQTGGASDGGQSFIGYAPNGDRYEFTRMVLREATWIPVGPSHLARWNALMLATRVEDVNGNWVTYTYDSSARLTRIESNDGRLITLGYVGSSKMINTVTANGRTWQYHYVNGSWGKELDRVTLPEGREWEFNLALMERKPNSGVACTAPNTKVEVTHPNGIEADFWLKETKHGRTRIPTSWDHSVGYCNNENPEAKHAYFEAMSIWKKTLSGPGYPSATWTYTYQQDNGNFTSGPDNLPDTRWTQIVDPLGYKTIHYHHRRVDNLENLLVKTSVFPTAGSSTPLQTTEYTYVVEGKAGITYLDNFENEVHLTQPRHQNVVTITRGSDVYTTDYDYSTNNNSSSYSYGSPTRIERSNNYTNTAYAPASLEELTTYTHKKAIWRLALPLTITHNSKLFNTYSYDGLGRVTQVDAFGSPLQEIEYNCSETQAPCTDSQSGTVKWVEDALNRRYSFSNYKRGRPQTITRPDSSSLAFVIDNNGWVTSETDPMLNTTTYQYNDDGWLTLINRPSPWSDTSIAYTAAGNGVTQTATRGPTRITTSYDGLTRPYLVETRAISGGGVTSYVKTSYDALSRVTFTSLPSTSSNPASGSNTSYDAIGRILSVAENMAPYATTSYQYLADGLTRATDPDSYVTDRYYNAYGSPGNAFLYRVIQPESVDTRIYSNDWLRPTRVRQSGGSLDHSQYFYYDAKLRRCRLQTPEGGSTAYAYNSADELTSYAKGITASVNCPGTSGTSKVNLSYDSLGRLTTTDYYSSADITRTYDDNSNLTTVSRGGANWTYTYISGLYLDTETLNIDGRTYSFDYDYNAEGILTRRLYPSGRPLEYSINGLGQVTKVEMPWLALQTLARNISYHVSGQLESAEYPNGSGYFVRSTSFTPRQQPETVTAVRGSTKAIDYSYQYDARGNITYANDYAAWYNTQSYTYDGLSRLTTASAYTFGSASYSYDPLGNILSKTEGGATTTITYDPMKNRPTHTTRSAGGGGSISYDARGNVTWLGSYYFMYDDADQPYVQYDSANGWTSEAYVYDGHLRRVRQQETGQQRVYSIYDKSGTLVHRDDLNTGETTDYMSVPGATIRMKGYTRTTVFTDHLGSPVAGVVNGSVDWRQHYKPYGGKVSISSGNSNEPGFTGHVQDDATGLTYMQARFYDPEIGRFLSIDPVGFKASRPSSFGRYTYVSNNPVSNIDPFGLEECSKGVSHGCTVYELDPSENDRQQQNQPTQLTAPSPSTPNVTPSTGNASSMETTAGVIYASYIFGPNVLYSMGLISHSTAATMILPRTVMGPVTMAVDGALVYDAQVTKQIPNSVREFRSANAAGAADLVIGGTAMGVAMGAAATGNIPLALAAAFTVGYNTTRGTLTLTDGIEIEHRPITWEKPSPNSMQ